MLRFSSINHTHSKIHPVFDGLSARISYLFSDAAVVAGASAHCFIAEEEWSHPSGQLKKAMIMDYARHKADPEYLESISKLYEALHLAKQKIKHETKEMIVGRKKLEAHLDQIYAEAVAVFKQSYARAGYLGLMPLVTAGELQLRGSHPEQPEYNENGAKAYSDMLRDYWTNQVDGFTFSHPFWDFLHEKNLRAASFDEADEQTDVLLFRLPQLPTLTTMTAAELKAIKLDLFRHPEMRQAIADWHKMLMKETYSPQKFSQWSDYFATRLLAYVQEAEKKSAENLLLNKMREMLDNKGNCHNFLCLCRADLVTDYMEWSGMIPADSMKAFRENPPENYRTDSAVLLLVNKPELNQPEEETTDKKSLRL